MSTLICKSIWSCEILTWNPAASPVCDVSRQLNVLHQAVSCSSCYDIRDIAIHVAETSPTTHDRFHPSWGSSVFNGTGCTNAVSYFSRYNIRNVTVRFHKGNYSQ
ncbi:hypothetical protein CSKR_100444, partial [Clonorchis sinensis]